MKLVVLKEWLAVITAFSTLVIVACPYAAVMAAEPVRRSVYRSPFDLAFASDGTLAVSDRTAGSLAMIERANERMIQDVMVWEQPSGVVWSPDGRFAYVAENMTGTVAEIDRFGKVTRRLEVGSRPVGLTMAPRHGWLLTANSASSTVSVVQLADGGERGRIKVRRMPYFLAVTADEKLAVVGNRLPEGDATDPGVSAMVSLIDLRSMTNVTDVRLPPNSTNVCGVAVSSDGRWAYVVHNLARAMLPTEQIEYGWINANAMTVIDLRQRRRYATILLDRFNDGAANPFAAAISPDGSKLWITLSGVHQIGKINLAQLHVALRKELPEDAAAQAPDDQPELNTARGSMDYSDTWQIGINDPTSVELVISDLPVEYGMGRYLPEVFTRADLPGNGPRGLAVSPDGREVAVAMYFSGTVVFVDGATMKVDRTVAVAPQPSANEVRRGEAIFHDADFCFQRWLSCSTCHPDGRADGLNWDLMNDGIGSPKNTRSMVLAHHTPPAMSRGVRSGMPAAAAAGFEFLLFQTPEAEELRAVEAYLRSLAPEPSPSLADGRLSGKARRGKAIFDSSQVGCSRCHPAPLFTDQLMHDVGTRGPYEMRDRFATPTLIEAWRTAPYMHNGRHATIEEMLIEGKHGTKPGGLDKLGARQIKDLVAFVLSL